MLFFEHIRNQVPLRSYLESKFLPFKTVIDLFVWFHSLDSFSVAHG